MSQDTQTGTGMISRRCPLKAYLENTWLPGFHRPGTSARSRSLVPIPRAHPWPKYPELQREPGTRRLAQVIQINQWSFILLAEDYMANVRDVYIENESLVEEEESPRLRLPSRGLVVYEDADVEFLSQISNEDDFVSIVQEYILGTVSEAIRLVEGVPLDDPLVAALKFHNASHLCSAHHAKWDILTLAGSGASPSPLAVVFVPPWEFGTQDFADLTAAQYFENGALDTLNTKPHTAADKIWAVIHDTCRGQGARFVVTNYIRWAFGDFNPEGTAARITDSFEAPILNLDGTHVAVPTWTGFNVVEFLTFWVHSALRRPAE